ncbi:hypothetical protein [Bacillus siamensis]|uniref:hypothetical protein n=1 Tax=Bacillus siamensis TaxID=659243 RepID=UPI001F520F4F|nr:hypothetical protein [Bacillus siamensis]
MLVEYQGLMVSKEKAELFKRLRIKFNLDAKSDLGYMPWLWDGVEYYGLESIDPYSTGVTFIRYDKSYLKSVSFEKMLNDKVKDESVREEILEKVREEEQPLLQIKLDDMTSIPEVYYKGEKITERVKVSFDWETATYYDESKANILIKRGVKDSLGQPTVETIETKKQGKIITTLVY